MKNKYFIYIGIILLIHWILLVTDRIKYEIPLNLLWISHLALLTSAIGFILRSNLILTASLISIFIMHGLWIIDFVFLLLGNSPSTYTEYVLRLTPERRILTFHHIYLIPLLFWALLKQRKINKHGWIIASIFFLILSTMSFYFLPREYNINCAHFVCIPITKILPSFAISNTLNQFIYLILLNLFMALFIFYLPYKVIYYIFKKFNK